MKTFKSKLAIAVLATAAVCAPVWAGCCKQDMKEIEAELHDAMFKDIDLVATIAKLPQEQQTQAEELLAVIEQGDAVFESGVEPSLEEEVRYETANERLFGLFDEHNVQEVEIDLLANLSDEDRDTVMSLVNDIDKMQDKRNISDAELAEIEQKMQQVDAMMSAVE